jgi:hypothetical protein
MIQEYIDYWRRLDVDQKPFVHPEDRDTLLNNNKFSFLSKGTTSCDIADSKQSKQLHLGLLPAPHTGDLTSAEIVIVALNPGYGVENYVEQDDVDFRNRLKQQIHQRFSSEDDYPLLTLDPATQGRGGYKWWNTQGRLGGVIQRIADHKFRNHPNRNGEARRLLAKTIATLEVMPYISKEYSARCNQIPSVKRARSLLHDYLKPRALSGELLVIVTRSLTNLGMPYGEKTQTLVLCNPKKARNLSLTPHSEGGGAILKWFGIEPEQSIA